MARDLSIEEMVRAELRRDGRATVADLHFLAARIDPAVADMSETAFQARYLSDVADEVPPSAPRKRAAKRTSKPRASKPRARRRSRASAPAAEQPATGRPAAAKRTDTDGPAAERVRAILNQFARDLSAAEDPADVIRVMAGMDHYVHRIVDGA
jgi:DNA primase